MKKIFLTSVLFAFSIISYSQYIYKIKADSVLITNDSCDAELIIENHTRNVCGFLYNKGNGRTEFKSALIKLSDSVYLVGCDTLKITGNNSSAWSLIGNFGINSSNNFLGTKNNASLRIKTNNSERMVVDSTGNVGIGTFTPQYKLDVNGGVRIIKNFGFTQAIASIGDGSDTLSRLSFGQQFNNSFYSPYIGTIKGYDVGTGIFSSAGNIGNYAGGNYVSSFMFDAQTSQGNPRGLVYFDNLNGHVFTVFKNGNFLIGGQSSIDAGYKLDVNGNARISSLPFIANRDTLLTYDPDTKQLKITKVSGGGGNTPTLQQVTNAGATTTNSITIDPTTGSSALYLTSTSILQTAPYGVGISNGLRPTHINSTGVIFSSLLGVSGDNYTSSAIDNTGRLVNFGGTVNSQNIGGAHDTLVALDITTGYGGNNYTPYSIRTAAGRIKFGGYGSGTITGTPTYNLAVDASGNVIEVTAGGGGSGTVTSVAMTTPSWLSVSGSPITTSGTLSVTATTGQTANQFLATPNGSTGAVGLRSIVAADIPNLDASKITTGTMATARLGSGTADNTTYLGGDQAYHSALMSKAITMVSPTSSENAMLFYTDVAITITKVAESTRGSSPSTTYNIKYASDRSTTGTSVFSSNRTVTSTTGTTTTTFASASIPAGSYVWLITSATSGSVNDFNITIVYRQ